MIVEEINEKHMGPWAEMCSKDAENTPITPFMDAELLQNCHLNLSNEKLKATGYRLTMPILTQESIEKVSFNRFHIQINEDFRMVLYLHISCFHHPHFPLQIISDFVKQKLLPASLLY